MQDTDGQICEVECLEPDVAKHTLGVRQCPSGTNDLALEYLHGMASKWKEEVQRGKME